MKTVILSTFLFLAGMSMVSCLWYVAVTEHQDRVYQNETERAYKGAYLQLLASGVVCRGA